MTVAALLVWAIAHGFGWLHGTATGVWVSLAIAGAFGSILALVYLWREEALADTFCLKPGDVARGLGGGILALLLTYGLGSALLQVAPVSTVQELFLTLHIRQVVHSEARRAFALVGWAMAIEVLWHGAVTHALESRVGSARAPWVAGGLACLVVVPTLHPLPVLAAVLVQLVTSGLTALLRRVWPAVLAHAAFTWLALDLVVPFLLQQRPN